MGGIAKLCKLYSTVRIDGAVWVWDYARDIPVKEKEMTKEQWAESEKVKWAQVKEQLEQEITKEKR